MSEATYYHATETGLAEGVSLGRITVALAPAYDSAVHLYLDAAERCIAAERREKALQLRLNTADQRNADAVSLAHRMLAVMRDEGWVELEADLIKFVDAGRASALKQCGACGNGCVECRVDKDSPVAGSGS